jgi:hypothetical protein
MSTLYKFEDRDLLISLLDGEGAFLGPASVLDGLSGEQAVAKPHGLPHSIAEIVAHMCFWQEWFNGCATRGFIPPPEQASEGWPEASVADWDATRSRYFAAVDEAKRIARTSTSLGDALLPTGVENPVLSRESYGSGILRAAAHSGHHLGQVITIRQLLRLWPPAAGSMTW